MHKGGRPSRNLPAGDGKDVGENSAECHHGDAVSDESERFFLCVEEGVLCKKVKHFIDRRFVYGMGSCRLSDGRAADDIAG